jgi:hypothetical protein
MENAKKWQVFTVGGVGQNAHKYDSAARETAVKHRRRAVAEMLGKMYRIAFGIFSPPASDWAEYEKHPVYFCPRCRVFFPPG